MVSTTTCEFSNPQNLGVDSWQYDTLVCSQDINSSVGFNPTSSIATTSDITIYGYYSAGEIMIALLLLILIILHLLDLLARGLERVKIKRKYLNYSGGDVEIRE